MGILREAGISEKGSAGVIEMSFILPMTMVVVISLIYLTFSMFLYVHLQSVAEVAADSLEEAVIESLKDVSSFSLSAVTIPAETEEKIRDEFEKRLNTLCVLPGMSVNLSFKTQYDALNPIIFVKMECIFFKGELFTASVERKVYSPKDFISNLDLILDVSEDTGAIDYARDKVEEVKKAYDEFFQ